jgi:pimeloyl-ACP methyl ester carboxylesterase
VSAGADAPSSAPAAPPGGSGTLFALVHGAWHGGWCWEPLVRELERLGHEAVAPDLPCDDPDAGAEAWAKLVHDALGGRGDAVVVGHSLAGATIPLVPARQLVFLCALVPIPGRSLADRLPTERFLPRGFGSTNVRDEQRRSRWVDFDQACEQLYHDCSRDAARRAFERLRPQAARVMAEVSPVEELPATPIASILCRGDRAVDPDWSRYAAAELLGVDALELEGGHSPMLAQPAELARVLDALARQAAPVQPPGAYDS